MESSGAPPALARVTGPGRGPDNGWGSRLAQLLLSIVLVPLAALSVLRIIPALRSTGYASVYGSVPNLIAIMGFSMTPLFRRADDESA